MERRLEDLERRLKDLEGALRLRRDTEEASGCPPDRDRRPANALRLRPGRARP